MLVGWLVGRLADLMFFPSNLLASTEQTTSNTTKQNMHPKHKYTITQNKHKKLKPDSVASYEHTAWKQSGSILIALEPTQDAK